MGSDPVNPEAIDFEPFVTEIRARLQRVLVARYGVQTGVDLTAEVEAWAWENFDRLRSMHNPLGYLYRVAQSKARPHLRWSRRAAFPGSMPEDGNSDHSMVEMHDLLAALTENQRVCVLLVHAHGWTYQEVAQTLDMSTAAVGNHVTRGLARLRGQIEPLGDPLVTDTEKEGRNGR